MENIKNSRHNFIFLLAFLLSFAYCQTIVAAPSYSAEVTPVKKQIAEFESIQSQSDEIIFRLSEDALPTGSIQLSNGVEVLKSDWPALVFADIPNPVSSKSGRCTMALVGPKVALTAAHCVDSWRDGRPLKPILAVDRHRLKLNCEIHPNYLKRDITIRSPRGSEDYSLCLIVDEDVQPYSLQQMKFEVLEIYNTLATRQPVLMTGFGCSELKLENGELVYNKSDNILRIGDETIDSIANNSGPEPTYIKIRSKNGKEPTLCPGDSGGPTFTGATTNKPNGQRRIIGVNSSIDCERAILENGTLGKCIEQSNGSYELISKISATGVDIFKSWVNDWLNRNKDETTKAEPIICGINKPSGVYPCRL